MAQGASGEAGGRRRSGEAERLAVVCGDQVRSATVSSMLRKAGADTYLVAGGMVDWLERDYPVEKASQY